MSPLVYLFLILLLNKCSCFSVTVVNISTLHILLSNPSEIKKNNRDIGLHSELQVNKENIQIVIFLASLMLLILFCLILCFICAKKYRMRHLHQSARQSISSIDQLVRERLQDRPPSYIDSQSHTIMTMSTEPPSYNEIVNNDNRFSSVYVLSKTDNNNGLTYLDDVSINSSPPDYIISEGAFNPIFENSELTKQLQTKPEEDISDPWISGNYI